MNFLKHTVNLLIITTDGESVITFVKPNKCVKISTQIYNNKRSVFTKNLVFFYHICAIIWHCTRCHTSIFYNIKWKFIWPICCYISLFNIIKTKLSLLTINKSFFPSVLLNIFTFLFASLCNFSGQTKNGVWAGWINVWSFSIYYK